MVSGTSSLKNKHSLRNRIFVYLICFSLLILIFLWLFQVLFLKYYYESFKTSELSSALSTIKVSYKYDKDSIYTLLENFSYDKGICSEIVTNNIMTYSTNPLNKGCLNYYDNKTNVLIEKTKFLKSDSKELRLRIVNSKQTNKTLVYGLKLDDKTTVFVNTSIDPIDSTVTILQNQLGMVTIIIIILSSVLAYFIANKLSNPITKMTSLSKELSKSDFTIDFNVDTDIVEIEDLANSLNHAKDELKKNDEIRRELMANVSHDLKTPLTMIKAYAEMVRDLSYKNEEKRNNDLNVIIDEVDRLNLLVNDILNLSKLESNIDHLDKEEFDLIQVVNTIIHRFKIFSVTEDCEFICHYPENVMINADKAKIEQVIYNLIGNAINYSLDKKKVYITILVKDKIRINITDIGPGIREKDIEKIWDKYYKADKSHKRNTIGTGLGLSIVKNILELHQYKYGVISKKDKGTTFYFEIDNTKKKKKKQYKRS